MLLPWSLLPGIIDSHSFPTFPDKYSLCGTWCSEEGVSMPLGAAGS